MQLKNMYDEVEALDAIVIAIAQEDRDLESNGKFHANVKPEPRFELCADFQRNDTKRYERTSTYLIDKQGVVQEIKSGPKTTEEIEEKTARLIK